MAVSGGPDSVALLHALATGAVAGLGGPILVAHLNHQLRGAESDGDEEFVRELCAALAGSCVLPLDWRGQRIDVAAKARAEAGNQEGVARRLRYAWLAELARREGIARVATGHTADDQAETVLHRLVRGTGLRGLRGIAPRRPLAPGVELIRPMLTVTRAEVVAYLEAKGQPFRQDRSNADVAYTRNRIRHELLPLLSTRFNPAIVSVLARLAEGAREAFAFQEAAAAALLAEAERPRAGPLVVLDRSRLAAAPRALVREAFRLLWEREDWPANGMTYRAWDRLAALAAGGSDSLDLPGGVRARSGERVVRVGRGA